MYPVDGGAQTKTPAEAYKSLINWSFSDDKESVEMDACLALLANITDTDIEEIILSVGSFPLAQLEGAISRLELIEVLKENLTAHHHFPSFIVNEHTAERLSKIFSTLGMAWSPAEGLTKKTIHGYKLLNALNECYSTFSGFSDIIDLCGKKHNQESMNVLFKIPHYNAVNMLEMIERDLIRYQTAEVKDSVKYEICTTPRLLGGIDIDKEINDCRTAIHSLKKMEKSSGISDRDTAASLFNEPPPWFEKTELMRQVINVKVLFHTIINEAIPGRADGKVQLDIKKQFSELSNEGVPLPSKEQVKLVVLKILEASNEPVNNAEGLNFSLKLFLNHSGLGSGFDFKEAAHKFYNLRHAALIDNWSIEPSFMFDKSLKSALVMRSKTPSPVSDDGYGSEQSNLQDDFSAILDDVKSLKTADNIKNLFATDQDHKDPDQIQEIFLNFINVIESHPRWAAVMIDPEVSQLLEQQFRKVGIFWQGGASRFTALELNTVKLIDALMFDVNQNVPMKHLLATLKSAHSKVMLKALFSPDHSSSILLKNRALERDLVKALFLLSGKGGKHSIEFETNLEVLHASKESLEQRLSDIRLLDAALLSCAKSHKIEVSLLTRNLYPLPSHTSAPSHLMRLQEKAAINFEAHIKSAIAGTFNSSELHDLRELIENLDRAGVVRPSAEQVAYTVSNIMNDYEEPILSNGSSARLSEAMLARAIKISINGVLGALNLPKNLDYTDALHNLCLRDKLQQAKKPMLGH